MIDKAKAGVFSLIKFVVGLLLLFGLIKWAQANPAQWQALVTNLIQAAMSVINAVLNAIVSALPKSSG